MSWTFDLASAVNGANGALGETLDPYTSHHSQNADGQNVDGQTAHCQSPAAGVYVSPARRLHDGYNSFCHHLPTSCGRMVLCCPVCTPIFPVCRFGASGFWASEFWASGPRVTDTLSGTSPSAITFDRVGLTLGTDRIYDSVDFQVGTGEFVCLLGPSGCGKSTSLRIIGDLLAPGSGRVLVNGRPPSDGWQDIAFVFQSPRLAPWRNALANVLLGAELRFGRREAKAREPLARDLLKLVGLGTSAAKYPLMLSGGERQRIAIARALAVEPSIILMDEPFSALDPNTRRRLRGEIIRIWQETKKTILFVTHDIEEAIVLADRIVLMSNKPTRILETIAIDTPRPRDLADPALRALRTRLDDLFQTLET